MKRDHAVYGESNPPGKTCLAGMVFLGSFLLFSLEPLIGRILTPWYGGTAHVWLICLMFYQFMLLTGYFYAHLFSRVIGRWHLFILLLPLANLPLWINNTVIAESSTVRLLSFLFARTSLAFLVLSTTAVVAQSWLARSAASGSGNPYPLYALSNAGSLAGLMAYPFVIEPIFGLRTQTYGWTFLYLVYVLFSVFAWLRLRPALYNARSEPTPSKDNQRPGTSSYGLWFVLSVFPSMFLVNVTNFIAMEAGPFPMVWIMPLALYLLSFIITFREQGATFRFLDALWPEFLLLGLFLYLLKSPHPLFLAGHLLVLFVVSVIANNALYARRPPAPYLTSFYLSIAAGGFIGGAVVALIMPLVFSGLFEYPLMLIAFAVIFRQLCREQFFRCLQTVSFPLLAGRILVAFVIFIFLALAVQTSIATTEKFRSRNFYGISRVIDEPSQSGPGSPIRMLLSGFTAHGVQFLDEKKRRHPTLYYSPRGGLGDAFALMPSPCRVGAIGLGVGTAGIYTRPGDRIMYYELNPDIAYIARTWFTYLKDTPASWGIAMGDGRLSLRVAPPQETYDLVFIDAFTGDGVPAHLLTREAMELYITRLTKDGIILLHITNRYYDFRPVIKATAASLGLAGAMNVPAQPDPENCEVRSDYVVLARDSGRLEGFIGKGWVSFGNNDGLRETRGWTDDYVNILAPLWFRYTGDRK